MKNFILTTQMKSLINTRLNDTPPNMAITYMNMINFYTEFPQFICKTFIVLVNPSTITHTEAFFLL